jgi:hypothetical protein
MEGKAIISAKQNVNDTKYNLRNNKHRHNPKMCKSSKKYVKANFACF